MTQSPISPSLEPEVVRPIVSTADRAEIPIPVKTEYDDSEIVTSPVDLPPVTH